MHRARECSAAEVAMAPSWGWLYLARIGGDRLSIGAARLRPAGNALPGLGQIARQTHKTNQSRKHLFLRICPIKVILLFWTRVSGRIYNPAVMGCVVDVVRGRIKQPMYAHMDANHGPGQQIFAPNEMLM